MISGKITEARKYLIGALLGMGFVVACGSTPIPIHEYIIDVDAQMLRGPKPKDDKPLSFCKGTLCYAYEDTDVRSIKKYIVELENQLKACQQKH